MIPVKISLENMVVETLPEFPQSEINIPMYKLGDKNIVENIGVMDFNEDRLEIALIFSSRFRRASSFQFYPEETE